MRILGAVLVLLGGLALPALAAGPSCPQGWVFQFSARESELRVVVLDEGTMFCAEGSDGSVSGPIRADGKTDLDAYLPEDGQWRIFGPKPEQFPPMPSESPGTPAPGPSNGSPAPAASELPDAAMEAPR